MIVIKDFSYKQFFTLPIITRKNSICHLKNGILVNKLIFNQSAKTNCMHKYDTEVF